MPPECLPTLIDNKHAHVLYRTEERRIASQSLFDGTARRKPKICGNRL